MHRFKLTVSYDGTDFSGWQVQPDRRTVQETLETAIAAVTGLLSRCNASGRTDAGVHAVGQVVDFATERAWEPVALRRAINVHLPHDLAVIDCSEVSTDFDANRHAVRKLYRYVIRDSAIPDVFMHRYYAPVRTRLDVAAMARAVLPLRGTHDFRCFETDWPNRNSSVRTITHISVNRAGEYVWIDVEADGFLYNMVRAIAGTLIQTGRGFWPESKVGELLDGGVRSDAGPTAPPQGLFLMRVAY